MKSQKVLEITQRKIYFVKTYINQSKSISQIKNCVAMLIIHSENAVKYDCIPCH